MLVDGYALKATAALASGGGGEINWREIMSETYELAVACLQTNYYGAKLTTEALLPLLHLSASPRIVNVSSELGKLLVTPEYVEILYKFKLIKGHMILFVVTGTFLIQNLYNEWAKGVLNDIESLTEERIDEVLNEFLRDFNDGVLEAKGWRGWPYHQSAYIISKAAMNAYTRLLAKKNPSFRVNCVCSGYVKTDLNHNTGVYTVEEGAECPVMAALLPDDGPSGSFFVRKEVSSFE